MIEFIDVHKSFGKHDVLAGINFRIERGETFAIIGRSGCGKSVTLKHMVGLLAPDKGTVIVDGIDVPSADPETMDKIRLKFGFLFQSGALLNSLNVADNIALPLREHKLIPEAEVPARVNEALSMLGLKQLEKVMPAELSGGMKKRVALARAIIAKPEIILYDEPTTGLDPIMSNIINDLIIQMKKALNVTSIVVTHDMKSTFKVADRIALLYEGKIFRSGTPKEFQASTDPYIKQFVDGASEGPFKDEDEEKLKKIVT
ncbi:MAG: ABC transporter ATP-binding protein [Planctomycetes bacterium]|nr:ABC transporter ATP-binding protein [Planctomycetota bacterium]